MRWNLSIICCFVFSNLWALVDYSEPEARPVVRRVQSPRPSPAPVQTVKTNQVTKRSAPSLGTFHLGTGYESISVKASEQDNKAAMYRVYGHLATKYNLFLEVFHWWANSDQVSSKTLQGNPTMLLGLNWLRWGEFAEQATVDIYGGVSYKGSNNGFASTRTDKIFGLQTTKRFYSFSLALSYEMRLTGNPSNAQEMEIGNIQKLSGTIGWVATPDIAFQLEGVNYRIGSGDSGERELVQQSKLSYSYVAPKAELILSPWVKLGLGARFLTKKMNSSQDMLPARLWDLPAAYGNSIFANLNLTI